MAYQASTRSSFIKVDPDLNNAPAWFPYQTHQGAPVPGSLQQAFKDPRRRARKKRQTLCYIAVTLAVCAIIILIAFLLAFFLIRKNKSNDMSTSTMHPVSGESTMHASTIMTTNGGQSTVSGGTVTSQPSTLSSSTNGGASQGSGGSTMVSVSAVSGDQSSVSASGTPSSLPSGTQASTTVQVNSSASSVDSTTASSSCSSIEFQCGNGVCISGSRVCDSTSDCGDGSDEKYCPCNETTRFKCTTSFECLDLTWKCDGSPDCIDKSDEAGCSDVETTTPSKGVETSTAKSLQGNCSINQFQCGNGICIELSRYCDSTADCGDSSDEANCECNETTHFRCTQSRECLSLDWKCDGLPDCLDVSDESNCGGCNETFLFGCNNTDRCIKKEWRCDGNQDCSDDSDEIGCVCNPATLFTCVSTGRCIKLSWVCDGESDCPDGSEERNCSARTTNPVTTTLV